MIYWRSKYDFNRRKTFYFENKLNIVQLILIKCLIYANNISTLQTTEFQLIIFDVWLLLIFK